MILILSVYGGWNCNWPTRLQNKIKKEFVKRKNENMT